MTPHDARVRELERTGRITAADADRLVEALGEKKPRWMGLVNPFDRLSTPAGWTIAGMVWLASIAISRLGVRFDGALDLHPVSAIPSFGVAWFDLANAVLLTAAVLWLTALAFARQGRLVDFIMTVSIARAALILTALAALWLFPPPEEMLALAQQASAAPPWRVLVGAVLTTLGLVWFFVLLNRGFKVSSGLKGARLGVAFTAGVLAAEVLSKVALAIAARARLFLPAVLAVVVAGGGIAAGAQTASPAAGDWTGHITLPSGRLDLTVTLTPGANGAWTGTADIPAQGARGLPLGDIAVTERAVSFRLRAGQGDPTFTGTLSDDGATISGAFTQAGATLPFELARSDAAPAARDLPAPGEPAALETATGVLHGTLVAPPSPGPHPVALLIAGSGPTDRNGNSPMLPGPNHSLALLAEGLAANGIASLRYDKRGIGASADAGPAETELRLDTYVDDAAAWVQWLRSAGRFSTVTVIGHSEGSLIGMLAADQADADAFISIAGPGRRAPEVLRDQLRPQLPPDLWEQSERILAELEAGRTTDAVPPALAALYRASVQPYLISWFRHDPAEALTRLRTPVLIAQGGTDIQVDAAEARALHAAKPEAALVIVAGMNHVLKLVPDDPAAQLASYSDPTLPVAPELITRASEFIGHVEPWR